jgi:pimeloyl-ACP methyl ester carboxylesterase
MSKIFYTEEGKGYPLVFLHGFCETHEIWRGFGERLSHEFKVYTLDLPGFGQSPLSPYEVSIDMIANEVYEWLLARNISECVMIGHSLGGYVTLEIAKKFPNILKAFGLVHSTAYADTPEKKENRTKSMEFIEKHGLDTFIDSFVSNLFYEKRKEDFTEQIAWVKQIAKSTPQDTVLKYTAAMRDRDDSIWFIKEYDKPILFIAGEHDSIIPINKSKEQIKWMKHPYIKLMPDVGHMGMIENHEECVNAIKRFVQVVI